MDGMEPTGPNLNLVDLPLEVFEVIAGYLSVRDLLACTACSHEMREIFNDDSIWRPRCDKQLCEYLKVTPCKVEPQFITPKFEDSSLSPPSQWKVDFIRQNHLWNNWRQGRKAEEVIYIPRSQPGLSPDNLAETASLIPFSANFYLFFNSDCIIAMYSNRIEFIDVSQSPLTKAVSDIELPSGFSNFKIIPSGNFVIITHQSSIQVYLIDFSNKISVLAHFFHFEDSKKVTGVHCAKDISNLLFDAQKYKYQCDSSIIVVGNLLISSQRGKSKIHIWNVESGIKIKEQDCLNVKGKECFVVDDFKRSKGKMNIIVRGRIKDENLNKKNTSWTWTYLTYDLVSFTFLPFQETLVRHGGFCCVNNYVAIWNSKILNVYNYLTSELIFSNERPIRFATGCQVFMENFLFIQSSNLKMFSPSCGLLRTVSLCNELNIPCAPNKVDWFEVLNDKFIQISVRSPTEISSQFDGWYQRDISFYEVVETPIFKKMLLKVGFNSCSYFLNKTSTRYIYTLVCGYVIHFW